MPNEIAVSAATGNIGSSLVRLLVERGHTPRVLLRDPTRLPPAMTDRVAVAVADLLDETSLTTALAGAETFFFCIPASHAMPDILAYYEGFSRVARKAIRAAGVKRVVFVSSGGRGRAKERSFFTALHAVEDELGLSGAAICALRCGSFMENLLAQAPRIARTRSIGFPLPASVEVPTVAVRDIAALAADACTDRSWDRKRFIAAHGAEDLSGDALGRGAGFPVSIPSAALSPVPALLPSRLCRSVKM